MKQITSILKFCIAFLAFILCINANAQTKLLVKNGQAAGDEFGTAVSLSGNGQVIAAGAPYNSANGVWAGQVRVYDFYGNQMGAPINGASSDRSGSAISLNQSGTRVAIGYSFNNTNGTASGRVRIFDWNGTSWVQAGNTLNGSQEGDYFGNAISLSADGMRLAIGAKGKDSNGADAGQVRIFDWNGNAWNQVGSPINGNSFTYLGSSVSLSADGTTVAIGAPLEGSDTGKVRLYSLNGNTWVQKGSDINGALHQTIRFGDALSLSADGNRVAIGAPLSNSNSYVAGVVKIYDYNGSNWNQIGDNLIGQPYDLFGASVSLSADGSRLAVGAEGWYDEPGRGSYAKLYRWQDNNWVAIGTQTIMSNLPDVAFGTSISLSADGNYLAVGGPKTDGNGENAGRFSVYSVKDSPPTALCKNVTVALDETATATIGVNTIDNGSTDDKNGYSVSISHNTFTIADLGSTIPVTLTITDTWGQTDSCIAQVTVVDTVFPTISCVQETTRSTDPGGLTYTVLGDEFDPSFSDNLPGASLFNFLNYTDSIEGEVFPVGEHPVVWTVVDSAGNGATCIIIISIVDTEVPMISCVQDATRDTDSGGLTYTVVGTEFDASFADNSGNATLTNDFNGSASLAGAEFPLGDTLVTWTAIDGSGNSNSCTVTLTVADTIAPTISCVQDATRDTDSGGLSYTVVGAEFDASLSDNDADTILTNDFNGTASLAGAVLPLGDTLVTWTANDGVGNSNYCEIIIVVQDTEAPSISCVQDATRSTDSGLSTYTAIGTEFDASFADNSGNATLMNDFNGTASLAGAVLPLGDTIVTWTASDGNGNINFCEMTVTVVDTEAPGLSCSENLSLTVTSSSCTIPVIFNTPVVQDNASPSGSVIQTAGLPSGSEFPVGTTTNTFEATDAAGNTTTCSFDVTVTVAESLTGYMSEIAGITDGDEFGISISLSADGLRMAVGASENDSNGEGAGQTRVYQWNGCGWVQLGAALNGDATEDWSGFSVSMSADGNRVAVSSFRNDNNGEDAGLVKLFDWNGTNWIQVGNDIIGTQAGDLFGHEISLSADGNRIAIGAISTVSSGFVQLFDWNGTTWTQVGTDILGSETGLSFGWSVSLSADGNRVAIGDPWDNDNGDNSGKTKVYDWNGSEWTQLGLAILGEASDNESGNVVRLSNDGNRLAIGAPLNNANGEYSGQVRVYDWSGNAWMQAGTNINGASAGDLFGGSVSLANNGNRLAIGASLKDDNGKNSGQVKIYDWDGNTWVQFGPDINGKAADFELGVSTSLSADGTRLAAGAPFDGTGYVATVILDATPVAVCQDITVNLDSNGTYTLSAADIDNGSFDNDGPVTLSIAPVSFDCSDLGTPVTVTLTVTDSIGQTATCTATVSVEDNEVPVITCAINDTRNTDAGTSEYTVQGTEFDATFTDNCTNATLINDFTGTSTLDGAVLPLGDTVVTWTVDDGNGNTAHCSTTLTVNASVVDETSLLSSYTIIGRKGVSLVGTKVTGGVGVKGQNKVARIWALSNVNGFVKSKHIWKGWWSSVDSLIYERTTVNLPNFHENTADQTCGINITVAPSQTLTLTDQIYNNVTVRQGGTLIIDSPEVYIKKLSTATNTTIHSNQSSAVMIDKTMQLGGNTSISQKTHIVTFYVEKDVTIGPGSQVNANIYTKQNLRLQPSSYRNKTRMTGQFIALNEVFASANSVWTSIGSTLDIAPTPNGPDNCGSEQKMVMNQSAETSYDTDIEITITKDAIVLYPVPTRDILNIKLTSPQDMPVNYSIVNGNGNVPISQKWDLTKGENTTKVDVSRLSDGQYYILFSVAGEQISKSFIILSGR